MTNEEYANKEYAKVLQGLKPHIHAIWDDIRCDEKLTPYVMALWDAIKAEEKRIKVKEPPAELLEKKRKYTLSCLDSSVELLKDLIGKKFTKYENAIEVTQTLQDCIDEELMDLIQSKRWWMGLGGKNWD